MLFIYTARLSIGLMVTLNLYCYNNIRISDIVETRKPMRVP